MSSIETVYRRDLGRGAIGLAAGGVSRVAFVEARGAVVLADDVTHHVCQLRPDPPIATRAIAELVAYDAEGTRSTASSSAVASRLRAR